MRYCFYCGKVIPNDGVFCGACGKRQDTAPPASARLEKKRPDDRPARPPDRGAATSAAKHPPVTASCVQHPSFWLRLGAGLLDVVALNLVLFIFFYAIAGLASLSSSHGNGPLVEYFSLLTMSIIIIPCYIYYDTSSWQATPGKLAVGLIVVDRNGHALSIKQAVVREFSKILSALPLGMGFIMIAFSKERQALHDRLAESYVVFKKPKPIRNEVAVKKTLRSQGRFTWPNGDRYDGEFVAHKPDGKGVFLYANGDRYEGEFSAGKFNGKGVYIWGPNSKWAGDRYEGDWVAGFRTGNGILTSANGRCYEGEFVNNKFNGKGVITHNGDTICEGSFVDDKLYGKGILLFPNGDRYEGEFVHDQITGRGILYYGNGKRYDGEWLSGKRTGKGVLLFPNGDRYDGDFLNNRMHGQGIYTYHDGKVERGLFRNNKYHGPAETTAESPERNSR